MNRTDVAGTVSRTIAARKPRINVNVTVTHGDARAWAKALADPEFRASLAEGRADLAAGRVVPLPEDDPSIQHEPTEEPK